MLFLIVVQTAFVSFLKNKAEKERYSMPAAAQVSR